MGQHPGKIRSIRGQIVEVAYPTAGDIPHIHQLLEVGGGTSNSPLLEVHGYREDRIVQTVALGSVLGLSRDLDVLPISEVELADDDLMGLVVDGVGKVMVEKDDTPASNPRSIFKPRSSPRKRETGVVRALDPQKVIATHIQAIDIFAPIIEGSKVGILGGAGVGKTVLMQALTEAFLMVKEEKRVAVFAGVGERIREAHELWLNYPPELKNQSVFVFGQMDRNAGERFRAAHTSIEIAEHYRDKGYKVLLFMDNIFRFVQAGAEISTMLGRMPSVLGYQPTLELELGGLQERLCSFENRAGSITSIQCVYMPSDDLTDPAVNAISRHMATTIVLDREIDRYPKMDLLRSKSRIMDTISESLGENLRRIFQEKKNLETKKKYHLLSSIELGFYESAEQIEVEMADKYRGPKAISLLQQGSAAKQQKIERFRATALGILKSLESSTNGSPK
jgi:F-type H+-transporting ATPase subunit beta